MRSTMLFAYLGTFPVTVLTQPSQGVQLGMPTVNPPISDIIFPLDVFQCEPVLIFYNLTYPFLLPILAPDDYDHVAEFSIPLGVGYLEWICNIPAGEGFLVFGDHGQYIVVQPGSSSSCLRSITATYSLVSYNTSGFQSYTHHPSNTASFALGTYLASTVPYPTGTFSTITANPDLSLHPASSSHKSKAPAIAGGIIGGLAIILLTFGLLFSYRRRRRESRLTNDEDPTRASEAVELSGPMTAQLVVPASERRQTFEVRSVIPSTSDAESPMAERVPPGFHKGAGSSLRSHPVILSYDGEASQTRESSHLQSNPTAALDNLPRIPPNTIQQDVPIGFTEDATSSSVAAENVAVHPGSSSSGGTESQNDRSNMITAIDAFSRLDPAERQTLVSMLHGVITSQTSSPGLARENTLRPPPPYDG